MELQDIQVQDSFTVTFKVLYGSAIPHGIGTLIKNRKEYIFLCVMKQTGAIWIFILEGEMLVYARLPQQIRPRTLCLFYAASLTARLLLSVRLIYTCLKKYSMQVKRKTKRNI